MGMRVVVAGRVGRGEAGPPLPWRIFPLSPLRERAGHTQACAPCIARERGLGPPDRPTHPTLPPQPPLPLLPPSPLLLTSYPAGRPPLHLQPRLQHVQRADQGGRQGARRRARDGGHDVRVVPGAAAAVGGGGGSAAASERMAGRRRRRTGSAPHLACPSLGRAGQPERRVPGRRQAGASP